MAMRQRSVAVAVPAPATIARRPRRRSTRALGGMAMLLPTVLILVGLVLYPFVYSIWLGFSDKTVGSAGQFVGSRELPLRHRVAAVQHRALVNTVVFTVCAVAHQARARDGGGARAQPADPRPELLPRLPAPALGDAGVRRLPGLALALRSAERADQLRPDRPRAHRRPRSRSSSERSTAMASVIVAHSWRELSLLRDLLPRRDADHRAGALRCRPGGRRLPLAAVPPRHAAGALPDHRRGPAAVDDLDRERVRAGLPADRAAAPRTRRWSTPCSPT